MMLPLPLYLLFLLSVTCYSAPQQDRDDGYSDVRVTISAIHDIIGWAKAHHNLLIVDFLFSLRVAQGEIDTSVRDAMLQTRPTDITTRLVILQEKLNNLVDIAFDKTSKKNSYYETFLPLISRVYRISDMFPSPRHLSSRDPGHEAPPSRYKMTYNEGDSDSCMVEILGSQDTKKCQLSQKCFKQMTNDRSEDYQLTHQLLFFLLAEMHGCDRQLADLCKANDTTLDQLIEKFVLKTYRRMPSVLNSGRYDLFLEMVFVGQMYNFEEFHQTSIRELLLLWHQPTGCYNDESKTTEELQEETKHIGRKILADELIDDFCSEHMTALALIVLCLTLNHQLRHLPSNGPFYSIPDEYTTLLPGLIILLIILLVLFVCLRKKRLRIIGSLARTLPL